MLIGLTGKKRAGKDSVAAALVYDHGFTRLAFADPLKDTALQVDPLVDIEDDERGPLRDAGWDKPLGPTERLSSLVVLVGWEAAKEVREVRRFLQDLGLAVRENVGETVWIDALVRRIPKGENVVITDVRFPNELEALADLGGVHVHVHRPGLVSTDPHPSEVALERYYDDAAATIVNVGTLSDLKFTVGAIHSVLANGFANL